MNVLVACEESQRVTIELRKKGINAFSCDLKKCSGGHKEILNADCEKIAVENPVNIIGGEYVKTYFPEYANLPKPSQYIQPYEYGDKSRKKTGLWLKGLPQLQPTELVDPILKSYICNDGRKVTFSADYLVSGDRSVKRSKTYPGIAKAMVEQWFNKEDFKK